MLTAVKGYYNGNRIVMDENVELAEGQEVIITVLETKQKPKENIDLSKYMGRGERMFDTDAGEFIKELRENDRI